MHQVEYAIEAINVAGTCVGLQSQEGLVLAAEKRVVSKLLAPSKSSEKTYTIDDHIVCLVAGLTADANILVQEARLASQRFVSAHSLNSPVSSRPSLIISPFPSPLVLTQISLQVPRAHAH